MHHVRGRALFCLAGPAIGQRNFLLLERCSRESSSACSTVEDRGNITGEARRGKASVSIDMSTRNQRFNLGVGFELMPQTVAGQFRKDFPPYVDGLVRSLPGNYVTTPRFAKKAEEVYNFKPREDDVYVITFPKSGISSYSNRPYTSNIIIKALPGCKSSYGW